MKTLLGKKQLRSIRASCRRYLLAAYNEQNPEEKRITSIKHPSVIAWRDAGSHAETWEQYDTCKTGCAR